MVPSPAATDDSPRHKTLPAADPGRRRRRRGVSLIRSRVVAPFDCLACEAPLAIVMADSQHNTYLMLGPLAKLRHGTIECECGAEREFVSINTPPSVPAPHTVDSLPVSA